MIISWWRELRSDKKMQRAAGLSLMLLIACGYYLHQFAQVKENTRQLEMLQQKKRVIERLQSHLSPDILPHSQLSDYLHQSARTWDIAIRTMTDSKDEVGLTLADVPFEQLLQWLAALQREKGVRVLKLDVERKEQPEGVVQVTQLRLAVHSVI